MYVALLRAVNVGGTGKLPMAELRRLCEEAGFADVRTYIASGNVLFRAAAGERAVAEALADRLEAHVGKPVGVLVRSAAEMAAVLAANPFPQAAPNRVAAIFLERAPEADALQHAVGRVDEEMALGKREIYVHYPGGMAKTRLRIPAAAAGTARNLNTVARLAAMAAG